MNARGPRLVVLGGSSPFVLELIRVLREALRDTADRLDLVLVGRDRRALRAVGGAATALCTPLCGRLRVEATADLEHALDGADLVLMQIRVGGLKGRKRDEELALEVGLPGDEGLGPGGLRCALRTLPVVRALVETMRRLCPRAWLLNLTSPMGLVMEAIRTAGFERAIGVCELPEATMARVARHVSERIDVGCADYLGVNHQGWIHHIRDESGQDITERVLQRIESRDLVGIDPAVIRREGAIPLPYLRLTYHLADSVAAQRERSVPRADEVRAIRDRLLMACEGWQREDPPPELGERFLGWYEQSVVPATLAIMRNRTTRQVLDVPQGGTVDWLPREAILELPCELDARGARPRALAPLPPGPRRLLERFVTYEAVAFDAIQCGTTAAIQEALALHPWVSDVELARRLTRQIRGD